MARLLSITISCRLCKESLFFTLVMTQQLDPDFELLIWHQENHSPWKKWDQRVNKKEFDEVLSVTAWPASSFFLSLWSRLLPEAFLADGPCLCLSHLTAISLISYTAAKLNNKSLWKAGLEKCYCLSLDGLLWSRCSLSTLLTGTCE